MKNTFATPKFKNQTPLTVGLRDYLLRVSKIRDTDGTRTMIIWINQKSVEQVMYKISE